jgi:hypothetical protein
MEAGDPSVSMDLLVTSLLLPGAGSADLAMPFEKERRTKGATRLSHSL